MKFNLFTVSQSLAIHVMSCISCVFLTKIRSQIWLANFYFPECDLCEHPVTYLHWWWNIDNVMPLLWWILISHHPIRWLLKMKERVSKLTYPTLQHCLRMLYTMNGNSKHKGQKRGYKLLLKMIKSEFPVKMHIYTLCPSLLQSFRKFCWAVSEELR